MSGVGSVASQAATNISDIGSQLAIGRTVGKHIGRAAKYNQKAELFQSAGSLVSSGFDLISKPPSPTATSKIQGGKERMGGTTVDWTTF